MKILIIGGGLFGCSAAIELARNKAFKVAIAEENDDIMLHASQCNHNRLHLGYHYLRSVPTAVQSLEGLLSFMFNYGQAAITQFPNYYAISKYGSNTTPEAFINFCQTVGIGYNEEFPDHSLLNRGLVDACFRVPEPIFDYDVLKKLVYRFLQHEKVELRLNSKIQSVKKASTGFVIDINDRQENFDVVVNATYKNINIFNRQLNLPYEKLLFEDVVIPFFLYPSEKIGLTVMDGEFCSVMPKGFNKNEFLLYHVKYSVLDRQFGFINAIDPQNNISKAVENIMEQSAQFYPFIRSSRYFGSWRTVRAVRENSADARVTELYSFNELDNYYSIMSAKISTCMQIALHLRHIIEGKETKKTFII